MKWIVAISLGGAALVVLAGTVAPDGLVAGWLAAVIFALQLSLGALALAAIQTLAGRGWGTALAPAFRGMILALPVALLAALPLLAVAEALFPWTAPEETLSEVVRAKLAYLDMPFLWLRAVICAAVWLILLPAALRWLRLGRGAQGSAVLGLIALALTASVLDVDWLMSLEPAFFSTVHPMLFMAASLVSAMAAAMLWYTLARGGDEAAVRRGEDIANLTFGFLLLWAYLHYMQWLIIWAGDRPHEIAWYLERSRDGWQWLLLAMVAVHLAAGVLLTLRPVKRDRRRAAGVAAAVLVGQGMDATWRVMPPLDGPGWPVLGTMALIGGLGAFAAWRPMGREVRDG